MRPIQPACYVAFYGTLMSEFDALDRLAARHQLQLVGPCRIAGRLFDLGDWPTLVPGEGIVHGELVEVIDETVFAALDPFEDYDPHDRESSIYQRVRVPLLEPAVEAWVYVANKPVPAQCEIASGSWREWLDANAA